MARSSRPSAEQNPTSFDAQSDQNGRTTTPRLVLSLPEDPVGTVIQAAALLLLKHPVAAQAAFSAFVAEGRRFAQTPEGRVWKTALARSELVRRGRVLWEDSPLNVLEDAPDTVLPSAILDAVVHAASQVDAHRLIARLFAAPVAEDDSHDS